MAKNRAIAIIRNTASNYARQALQTLIFVLLTPFIVRKVGADDFGLWSLVQATIGLLGLMDMGYSASVVKYVADARGRGDSERTGNLTATFFWLYAALGALTIAATVAVAPFLPSLLGIPADKARTGQFVWILIGIRSATGLPLGLFAGILVGYQKQVLSNASRLLGTLSYALVTWWALSMSPSLETLAWTSLATGVGANLIAMLFCIGSTPGMSLSPRRFRRPLLREISTFSLWFFLIQVSLLLATRVDTLVINAFLPLAAVALYTVAIRVAEKASVLCRQLANALAPMIAELKGAGEERNVRAVFLKGSMLGVACAAPLLVGLFWLADETLAVWMGEEFRSAALPCRLLLAAAMVSVVHGNTENVLSMTGHQKYLALASLGGQVLNLLLTLALVRPLGIAGVALATLVAQCAVQFLFIQRRAGEVYGVTRSQFYRGTLSPSIPGSVACVGAIAAGSVALPPTSLPAIAGLLAWGGLCFGAAFWFAGLSRDDRAYFAGRLRALRSKNSRAPLAAEATS